MIGITPGGQSPSPMSAPNPALSPAGFAAGDDGTSPAVFLSLGGLVTLAAMVALFLYGWRRRWQRLSRPDTAGVPADDPTMRLR
jgi:hypothetical protein